MGGASRGNQQGSSTDYQRVRNRGNAGSFNQHAGNLAAGAATRFKRKHPLPGIGNRFGELSVVGIERVRFGACEQDVARVQCSCGAPPHIVHLSNLRKGASTRCNVCAKKKAGHWRKNYWAYADVCPDDAHRRRLLGRISACVQRCENPRNSMFEHYGKRGIRVHAAWVSSRRAFLAYVVTLDGWDIPELELDRVDVDRGYEPGNLRFVSRSENLRNKRQVGTLQARILELEARVRYLERRLTEQVHDPD